MLEHSAMYLNVTPPFEEDTSFFPDFYTTRLGPCEMQDPVWAKMSALAAGVNTNKKKKKSETKPQAQINKCNNEKRRREQENIYIEELAELISANIADMSSMSSLSVKPDKCAILQEAVNQIRSIKQETGQQQAQSDPVQQGEVSSSRPTILSNELYGPLLLEALEGFLFVVNNEGKVEHVTENVSTYIKFTKEDVLGKSIYNFIHHGDHAKFHSNLLPMTNEWVNEQTSNRSKSIDIRLLVKPPDDFDETVEEKQLRTSSYELMHISSTQLRDQLISEEDGSDSGPCLLCVASRISHRDKTSCSIEQFTTKLDTSGKIICVDTSGVTEVIAQYIKKDLRNRVLRELVPQSEVHKVNTHLRETVNTGQSTSAIYRLQISPDKVIQVQTKSKLFKTHATNDSDFIMSTHSIISENDAGAPTDPGGGNSTSINTSVGGPLMTSVVNGTRNGPENPAATSSSPSNPLLNQNTSFSTISTFTLEDFNYEIPSSSTLVWPDHDLWPESRPDSRHSVTTPTPRSPGPPYTNTGGGMAQSSPFGIQTSSPSVQNPPTPAAYSGTFTFSPLNEHQTSYPVEEQKDTKANNPEDNNMMAEQSAKLRGLLTRPEFRSKNSSGGDKILKELLEKPDDTGARDDNRSSSRGLNRANIPATIPGADPPKTGNSSSNGGNQMLLQLLNDKSSDDEESRGAGVKNKSELLQQLLKNEKDSDEERKNDAQAQMDDKLLRSLGFPPSPNNNKSKKRSGEDKDDGPNKRPGDGSHVSTSLREKNKMLASLLARQTTNNQPIPPVPAHVITATPQEKLPKITDPNKSIQQHMNMNQHQQGMGTMANSMNPLINRIPNRLPGRPSQQQQQQNYLTQALTVNNNNNIQRNDAHLLTQVNSNCYTMPITSAIENNSNNNINNWQNNLDNLQTLNDPMLSDILDEVIDIVPDIRMQDESDPQKVDATMAIEYIQKSLMQCESVMKSPASPMSLPGTPPTYSTSGLVNQSGGFPPPPNYSQAKFQQRLRAAGTQQYSNMLNNPLLLQQQQQRKLQQQQQQQEKLRLLRQQKQQHLLIPSNAAANEINAMQNIDSLLNNTVAPNVSLQRSTSVPEPQQSPGFNQSQRVGGQQQQPYSPHSQMTSPLGQQSFPQTTVGNYQNAGARLSPQSQFSSQLSPRQSYPPQPNVPTSTWQQQTQTRMNLQQNTIINSQLTGNFGQPNSGGRNFQRPTQQQQRPIQSPNSVLPTRHSPYPVDQFAQPTSPNSAAFNNQYLRLQRTNSAPNATTQLPGGLGSPPPRPYGAREHHHSHPYPNLTPHPVPPPPQPPPSMMYQQDSSQYCYDQTGMPIVGYPGTDSRGQPGVPHLQQGVNTVAGPSKEFVRQELRAVVGARTAQARPATPQSRTSQQQQQQQLMNQQQATQQQQQTVSDLDSLGITYEMATGASDSPKLWGAMGSSMSAMSPQPPTSRNSTEESRQGDQKSSSLLQKLLSE